MKKTNTLCILYLAVFIFTLFSCRRSFTENESSPTTMRALFTQDTSFTVNEVLSSEAEVTRTANWFHLSAFYPTGLFCNVGTDLKVFVEQVSGTTLPKLLLGTLARNEIKDYTVQSVQLTPGLNTLSPQKGGLVWIKYESENPNAQAKIRFESGFKRVPYYKLNKTTNQQWKDMLATSDSTDALLVGDNCMVVVNKESAIKYQDKDQADALNTITRIINIENEISGFDNSAPEHAPNIHPYLLVQVTGGNPNATHQRTAYPYVEWLLDPAISKGNGSNDGGGGWGLWHEIGHQHQQSWTWSTIVEVTVNIYSLAVQRKFNPEANRLLASWDDAMKYLAKPEAEKNFNTSEDLSVWTRLCMFEQLRLAFGDEFYKNLHKQARLRNPTLVVSINDKDKAMKEFMRISYLATGKNLKAFFKKWGMTLSTVEITDDLYSELDQLNYPAPTIDPSTLRQ